jgi:hypothetical protein
LVWLQSTCALLAEIIKSGLKQLSKQMREIKIGFLRTFVYFIKKIISKAHLAPRDNFATL